MSKKHSKIDINVCVACGACAKECPKGAISIYKGCHAVVDMDLCVGCGICSRICPAGSIEIICVEAENEK